MWPDRNIRSVLIVAGIVACGASARAAVIDTFEAGAFSASTSSGIVEAVQGVPTPLDESEVIGGVRKVTMELLEGRQVSVEINAIDLGLSALSSNFGSLGQWMLEYGSEAPLGADLTDGGLSNRFFIPFLSDDKDAQIIIDITDADGNTGTASQTRSVGPFSFPFADFAFAAGAVDFGAIDHIKITINGVESGDYALESIETNFVPTPDALASGLVLLGVVVLFRRRGRRRTARAA